jgi:hypothetical protein
MRENLRKGNVMVSALWSLNWETLILAHGAKVSNMEKEFSDRLQELPIKESGRKTVRMDTEKKWLVKTIFMKDILSKVWKVVWGNKLFSMVTVTKVIITWTNFRAAGYITGQTVPTILAISRMDRSTAKRYGDLSYKTATRITANIKMARNVDLANILGRGEIFTSVISKMI